jgi:glycosyltransferase involved in cell wall biosynthesis
MSLRISVVTVVRNGAGTIEETLRSVQAQTYGDIEQIVVDGASTDGTLDIVERYRAKLAGVVSEPDRGIYDAMNKGLALATGEVVGFLNSDDYYEHDRVLEKVAQVMADPAVDACYADLVYVDPRDSSRVVRYWKSRPYQRGLCSKGWLPAHPTFFVRREIFRKHGGFDLAFPRQADFELSLRFLDIHKIRATYVPEVWVRMRAGGVSNRSIAGVLKGNLEAYRACEKNGVGVTPWFVVRKLLSRVPQFFSRPKGGATA